jgi:hypothetical protein
VGGGVGSYERAGIGPEVGGDVGWLIGGGVGPYGVGSGTALGDGVDS